MPYCIRIGQGDLLEEPSADFIVNPSNTALILGSGVSAAFARACGPQLQQRMTQKRKETQPLAKGDVVETPPGRCSRFHAVLHACVMDYNPGASETAPTPNDIEVILNNIESVVSRAARGRDTPVKLVMPLMGTGVGGLDKETVIEIYRRFFSRPVSFACDVVLYGHTPQDARRLGLAFSGGSFRPDARCVHAPS